MKTLLTLFIILTGFSVNYAFAGPGHDHDHGHAHGPISSEDAIKRASKKILNLVKKGKIHESWSKVKSANALKKTFSKGPEWVVTFKNDKVSDASKQTLYFFYSLDGHYIAANFTGN